MEESRIIKMINNNPSIISTINNPTDEMKLLAIKKDGLWGAIDANGKVVVDTKYNLDNNLLIDFIGKWHLGQDLNMNYYCEK